MVGIPQENSRIQPRDQCYSAFHASRQTKSNLRKRGRPPSHSPCSRAATPTWRHRKGFHSARPRINHPTRSTGHLCRSTSKTLDREAKRRVSESPIQTRPLETQRQLQTRSSLNQTQRQLHGSYGTCEQGRESQSLPQQFLAWWL